MVVVIVIVIVIVTAGSSAMTRVKKQHWDDYCFAHRRCISHSHRDCYQHYEPAMVQTSVLRSPVAKLVDYCALSLFRVDREEWGVGERTTNYGKYSYLNFSYNITTS